MVGEVSRDVVTLGLVLFRGLITWQTRNRRLAHGDLRFWEGERENNTIKALNQTFWCFFSLLLVLGGFF
jgi:hypothetical protein